MDLGRAFEGKGICLSGLHDIYHDIFMAAGEFLSRGVIYYLGCLYPNFDCLGYPHPNLLGRL
jgi:hypothetical protein